MRVTALEPQEWNQEVNPISQAEMYRLYPSRAQALSPSMFGLLF